MAIPTTATSHLPEETLLRKTANGYIHLGAYHNKHLQRKASSSRKRTSVDSASKHCAELCMSEQVLLLYAMDCQISGLVDIDHNVMVMARLRAPYQRITTICAAISRLGEFRLGCRGLRLSGRCRHHHHFSACFSRLLLVLESGVRQWCCRSRCCHLSS